MKTKEHGNDPKSNEIKMKDPKVFVHATIRQAIDYCHSKVEDVSVLYKLSIPSTVNGKRDVVVVDRRIINRYITICKMPNVYNAGFECTVQALEASTFVLLSQTIRRVLACLYEDLGTHNASANISY